MDRSRLILLGGCCLAFLAAALNTSFMVLLGTSVSHLTGDLSRFAIDLTVGGQDAHATVIFLVAALTGFVLGATISGVFIHHPRLEFSRPYGRSVSSIGLLLVAAWLVLPRSEVLAVLLAAMACGFQNALATHFRGVILRTTHVTGLLTDLGVHIGMRLRGHEIDPFKIAVPFCLVVAFFAGAACGAYASVRLDDRVFLALGCTYLAGGVGWTMLKHIVLPRVSRG